MAAKRKPLSKRAEKLLLRVKRGEWYPVYDVKTPAAMQELIDAGLVRTAGRVARVILCFVPNGTKPFKVEDYPQ